MTVNIMGDWSVCESDDEWKVYDEPQGMSNDFYIPERLAKLFNEIEKKTVLPLSCYCPRTGPPKENKESTQTTVSQPSVPSKEEKTEQDKNMANEQNKSFEAFEFDDDNEKPSLKRKTPASAKRPKKEKVSSSMSNVMNDLMRHKKLDELDAKKAEEST